MLLGLFTLLACQLAGEVIVCGLGWPVPGPVIGIVLLFALLCVHGYVRKPEAAERGDVAKAADALLASLGFVFVPAGVGVSQHSGLIFDNGFALVAALLISTVLTLIVTVGVFHAVSLLRPYRQVRP